MREQERTPGRQPMPDAEKRQNWGVPLNASEQEAIRVAAERAGLPPRVWARQALNQASGHLPAGRDRAAQPAGATRAPAQEG